MINAFKAMLPPRLKKLIKVILYPLKFRELDAKIKQLEESSRRSDEFIKEQVVPAYVAELHARINELRAVHEEPQFNHLKSQLVSQDQIDSDAFHEWCRAIKHPVKYHRKLWEWVYILEGLKQEKCITGGFRGLGFGVGTERIVSFLASHGCKITATDQFPDQAANAGWMKDGQYAQALSDLNQYGLCSAEDFARNTVYRHVDMNNIDEDLRGFDFLWSSCALEHLGSLQAGLDFIFKSLECLRDGGVAIHTTEYNLTSDEETIESGQTVLYRRKDILALQVELKKQHHDLEVVLNTGRKRNDYIMASEPYDHDKSHLKILSDGFVMTSLGLIIRKGGG